MEKVQNIIMEDGSRAERHIKEEEVGDCESVTVTELHVEKKNPVYLAERVIEKKRPVVFERHIEVINSEGVIIETKVESIDPPESKMQLTNHKTYVDENEISSQSIEDCDCTVTREELAEVITSLVHTMKGNTITSPQVSAMQVQTGERVKQSQEKSSLGKSVLLVIVAAQVAALAYILFIM